MRRHGLSTVASLAWVAIATALMRAGALEHPTTVAMIYLLLVLFVAAFTELVPAVAAAIAATLCFNFFFLPPVGTFTIADPNNWVALIAFLIVSIVAGQLSERARSRTRDALDRRLELTRLFDLTRDILLTTEGEGATDAVARHVSRRFELDAVAICVPSPGGGWTVHQGAVDARTPQSADLDRAFAGARGLVEFDARTRAYGGHRAVDAGTGGLMLAPIRIGTRAVGLLGVGGRVLEPGTLDAVAGIVAIALERSQFLDDRRIAELSQQRAELSSALVSSMSHDLRTPLTAIRAAISNFQEPALTPEQRLEQARVAGEQVERLTRLFDELLDMARIDSGSVQAERARTSPAEVLDAALTHAADAIGTRRVEVDASDDVTVDIDPRLTSSAVAHLLENAARYSPADTAIQVRAWADAEGLRIDVRDQGPGLDPAEIERLFEPFYRGQALRNRIPGTGMGLAIVRGLLAAQGGRVWAQNVDPRGAAFSIAVPGRVLKGTEAAYP